MIASSGPYSGSSFVGGPGAATINQFNTATGALTNSYSVQGGNGTGGTDWTELQSGTGNNILYDGEGTAIRSFNLATMTQNPDFTSAATEAALTHIFAFRVIPVRHGCGRRAGRQQHRYRVARTPPGDIIDTYTLPGNGGGDFSLNLDPNGIDFWTGDDITGRMWEVNIAHGRDRQHVPDVRQRMPLWRVRVRGADCGQHARAGAAGAHRNWVDRDRPGPPAQSVLNFPRSTC